VWLLLSFGLPYVLAKLAPASGALVSAALGVAIGAMVRPALTLAAIGIAILASSLLWPSMQARQGAAKIDRASRPRAAQQRPRPGRPTTPAHISHPNEAPAPSAVGYQAQPGIAPQNSYPAQSGSYPQGYSQHPPVPQNQYPANSNSPTQGTYQPNQAQHPPYDNQGWGANQGPAPGSPPIPEPNADRTQAFPPVYSSQRTRPTTVRVPPPTEAPSSFPHQSEKQPPVGPKGPVWIEGVGFVDENDNPK